MSQHKPPPVVDLDIGRIDEILRHAEAKGLAKEDLDTIRSVFESYAWLTDALGKKNASIGRLLKMFFGARRQFVEIVDNFPAECRRVLEAFQAIYHHDALARQEHLSPAARLAFHQQKSGPVMDDLHA